MKYYLLGTVIGDICGSRFEWAKPDKISPEFKFITTKSRFTDDTVLTMAVAAALLKDRPFDMMIEKFYKKYPDKGYGRMFREWANSGTRIPYNSFGNGGAMRLLPVPLFYSEFPEMIMGAMQQSAATHNHPESLKAVQLLSHAIFLAKENKNKAEIYNILNRTYGYEAAVPGDIDIRKNSLKAMPGVTEALNCFFYGNDFVEVLRESIKHGGDTDTIAAMACGLAYTFFEKAPLDLIERVLTIIPQEFRIIIKKFAKATENKDTKNITKKLF